MKRTKNNKREMAIMNLCGHKFKDSKVFRNYDPCGDVTDEGLTALRAMFDDWNERRGAAQAHIAQLIQGSK
jgi:hypothetical protein